MSNKFSVTCPRCKKEIESCEDLEFSQEFNGYFTYQFNDDGTVDWSTPEFDGDTSNNIVVCKNCGEILKNFDVDWNVDGFTELIIKEK